MTRQQFYEECTAVLISPFYAIENEKIKQALKDRNDNKVKELLKSEF